jgi:hypothetical protein
MRGTNMLYNLADVSDAAGVLKSLNRYPVEVDTYLISGRPILHQETLEKMKQTRERILAASKKKSLSPIAKQRKLTKDNEWMSFYWVSERDLVTRGFELNEYAKPNNNNANNSENFDDAVPFEVAGANKKFSQMNRTVLMYNVDQLKHPEAGFVMAGSKGVL